MYRFIYYRKYLLTCLLLLAVAGSKAQVAFNLPANTPNGNITKAEYFFDADPGYGHGTNIPVTPAQDLSISNAPVNLTGLANGPHLLFVRTKDIHDAWSHNSYKTFFIYQLSSGLPQNTSLYNINKVEYFFDTDPGFGMGTNIPFTPAIDITLTNAAVDLTGLSKGVHRIYTRSRDLTGKWSHANVITFFIYSLSAALPQNTTTHNLNKLEYFFDNDPGLGQGTNIPVTPAVDISLTNTAVTTTGLSQGVHRLYLRSRDVNGTWSLTNIQTFNIVNLINTIPANSAPVNITKFEYFVDTDPGLGNATAINITPGLDVSLTNYPVVIGNLSTGVHRFYVRSKTIDGTWSLTNINNVAITNNISLPANPTPGLLTKLEYFVDTDPGFGNGTTVAVPPGVDLNNFNFTANIGTLANGNHTFYLRTYDTWSLSYVMPFFVGVPLPVNWLYVRAQLTNDKTTVTWGTAQEINTKLFIVERSANGSDFTPLATVTAAGNTNKPTDYSFLDASPVNGINYYRIKEVDIDGHSKYSDIVTVFKKDGSQPTVIAPNPVKDILNIIESKPGFINTLEVYAINGTLLISKPVRTEVSIYSLPVGQLPAGNYLLKITYTAETKTLRFIKQ